MTHRLANRFSAIAVALMMIGAAGASAPVMAQGACLSNQEIQEAVASGQIAAVSSVLAREGIGQDTQVLSVRVCDQGGQLQYILAVLGPAGDARNITVNAR